MSRIQARPSSLWRKRTMGSSASTSRIASAVARALGSVSRQLGTDRAITAWPGMSDATTGMPTARASSTAKGMPSARLGLTNTSAAA